MGRGRAAGHPARPAQIRTCATNASGSCIESERETLVWLGVEDADRRNPAADAAREPRPPAPPSCAAPDRHAPEAVRHVVQKIVEPQRTIPPRRFTHPDEAHVRFRGALRPRHGVTAKAPLCRGPSLHRLRHRYSGIVRPLHRYYDLVRLPDRLSRNIMAIAFLRERRSVTHGLDLPGSVQNTSLHATGLLTPRNRDTARVCAVSRVAFPLTQQGRRSSRLISELDTVPALPPVNA
jgi:hypothetical protein